jgi:hypothetical protein
VKDASLAQVPEDPVEDTELQLAPRLKWDQFKMAGLVYRFYIT